LRHRRPIGPSYFPATKDEFITVYKSNILSTITHLADAGRENTPTALGEIGKLNTLPIHARNLDKERRNMHNFRGR
jgi:hypothetical protein